MYGIQYPNAASSVNNANLPNNPYGLNNISSGNDSGDLGDTDLPEVWVESVWRKVGQVGAEYDKAQQTDPIDYKENETQTKQNESIETQTETISGTLKVDAPIKGDIQGFLKRTIPLIEAQLNANLESRAFDDWQVSWEEDRDGINCLHTLVHTVIENKSKESVVLKGCSDLSWNCSGAFVAVSYGLADHTGWCAHPGTIGVWNTMKRQMKNSHADIVLETPTCCMCTTFHPDSPTILAGGLFNGEIRIWDIGNTDSGELLLCKSSTDDSTHREPVTKLVWVKSIAERTYNIVSVSGDGKILFWSLENKLAYPIGGVLLTPTTMYHGQGERNKFPFIGVSSVDFSKDYNTYTVGTELGGVIKCLRKNVGVSTQQTTQYGEFKWANDAYKFFDNAERPNKIELRKIIEKYAKDQKLDTIRLSDIYASSPPANLLYPTVSAYILAFEAHSGPVYGLHFSPLHRNLFLTCSTDSQLRIYNTLQPAPLLKLEIANAGYLFDGCWSPARALVFGVCDSEGKIYIYDLLENMFEPVVTIVANTDKIPIYAISFNSRDPSLLASCDANGTTKVWQLSARLSSLQTEEMSILNKLGADIQNKDVKDIRIG